MEKLEIVDFCRVTEKSTISRVDCISNLYDGTVIWWSNVKGWVKSRGFPKMRWWMPRWPNPSTHQSELKEKFSSVYFTYLYYGYGRSAYWTLTQKVQCTLLVNDDFWVVQSFEVELKDTDTTRIIQSKYILFLIFNWSYFGSEM